MIKINKPHYNINDLVMFYNTYNYNLTNKLCPKCQGSGKIAYLDENNKISSIKCNCYIGFVSDKEKEFNKNDKFTNNVSFGIIKSMKLFSDGNHQYEIHSLNEWGDETHKELLRYSKFFKLEYKYFDFPIESGVISYSVYHDEIIKTIDKFEKKELLFNIPEYNFLYNEGDEVYFFEKTWVSNICPLCNNTRYILDINNNKIKCPKLCGNYSGRNEYKLLKGVIKKISLDISISKEANCIATGEQLNIQYVLNVESAVGLDGSISKYISKYIYLANSNHISKNLNEILFILEKTKLLY